MGAGFSGFLAKAPWLGTSSKSDLPGTHDRGLSAFLAVTGRMSAMGGKRTFADVACHVLN
jgi:hypothetical protein